MPRQTPITQDHYQRNERLRVAAYKCQNPFGEKGISSDWIEAFLALCKILREEGWVDALNRLAKYWDEKLDGRPAEKRGLIALLKKGIAGASNDVITDKIKKVYKDGGATSWLKSQFSDELIAVAPQRPSSGPVSPDEFWWKGTTVRGLSIPQFQLLSVLCDDGELKPGVPENDVIKHVYNVTENREIDDKRRALQELRRRTDKKIRNLRLKTDLTNGNLRLIEF